VAGSGHYLQRDEPNLVVASIEGILGTLGSVG
jgi:hypothetical protein